MEGGKERVILSQISRVVVKKAKKVKKIGMMLKILKKIHID
jgi:hypothetical protein